MSTKRDIENDEFGHGKKNYDFQEGSVRKENLFQVCSEQL